ncbi:MAG: PepSY domain-containing protein [Enterobacterales bacterium]|nr:PepSY domain-containing protein [Enterobacterales bacterium]
MTGNFLSRLHKILAMIIGLQLIIWIISGLVFSFIDHDAVDGKNLYRKSNHAALNTALDTSQLLRQYPNALEVTQMMLFNRSVVKVKSQPTNADTKAHWDLLDSQSFKPIAINHKIMVQLAEQGYKGSGQLQQLTLVKRRDDENRDFSLPVWQLIYDDNEESHLYFSATSGEYLGARTSSWRVFDFFIMLHFMDYFARDDFNTPWIIFAALLMLFFSTSGLLLIKQGFSRKDFIHLYQKWFRKKPIKVLLIDQNGQEIQLLADQGQRLFDLLQQHDIPVTTICGGGGLCGRCIVRLPHLQGEAIAEDKHKRISDEQWQQGYRLSCQTYLTGDISCEIKELKNHGELILSLKKA